MNEVPKPLHYRVKESELTLCGWGVFVNMLEDRTTSRIHWATCPECKQMIEQIKVDLAELVPTEIVHYVRGMHNGAPICGIGYEKLYGTRYSISIRIAHVTCEDCQDVIAVIKGQ